MATSEAPPNYPLHSFKQVISSSMPIPRGQVAMGRNDLLMCVWLTSFPEMPTMVADPFGFRRIIERAATLYGELYRQGTLLPDADLLIAATALDAQRTLVTNNLAHFQRIPQLTIETWKR